MAYSKFSVLFISLYGLALFIEISGAPRNQNHGHSHDHGHSNGGREEGGNVNFYDQGGGNKKDASDGFPASIIEVFIQELTNDQLGDIAEGLDDNTLIQVANLINATLYGEILENIPKPVVVGVLKSIFSNHDIKEDIANIKDVPANIDIAKLSDSKLIDTIAQLPAAELGRVLSGLPSEFKEKTIRALPKEYKGQAIKALPGDLLKKILQLIPDATLQKIVAEAFAK